MTYSILLNGDARHIALPDRSVHCVVTSIPYFGLREYDTARWEGGDPNCKHKKGTESRRSTKTSTINFSTATSQGHNLESYGDVCGKCGAVKVWDLQIGQEKTIPDFVNVVVQIFREIRRVLRDDGVAFLNIGDSYAGGKGKSNQAWSGSHLERETLQKGYHHIAGKGDMRALDDAAALRKIGVKPKDLCLIPERILIALQDDGWWVRNKIIWHKPNAMSESMKDRCTRSYELVYVLTKKAHYYWDWYAIAEPVKEVSIARAKRAVSDNHKYKDGAAGQTNQGVFKPREADHDRPVLALANKRDVWSMATSSYRGSHYAVFPTDLPRTCILAATSAHGVCPKCGAPYKRVIIKTVIEQSENGDKPKKIVQYRLGGWQASCKCNAGDPVPATVLDPFCGSGTTGVVAGNLSRNFVGIDLGYKYLADLASVRIAKEGHPEPTPMELPIEFTMDEEPVNEMVQMEMQM